jgi:hypothetical protein
MLIIFLNSKNMEDTMNYNYNDLVKQTVINPGRWANDLGFNTLAAVHDTTEKVLATALDRAPWLKDENRNAVHEWIETVKAGRNNIKSLLDENINAFERFIEAL